MSLSRRRARGQAIQENAEHEDSMARHRQMHAGKRCFFSLWARSLPTRGLTRSFSWRRQRDQQRMLDEQMAEVHRREWLEGPRYGRASHQHFNHEERVINRSALSQLTPH